MNQQIEDYIKSIIFPELEKGRPNFDKPHTEAVVFHIKEILKKNKDLDDNVLITSAYAHDWGYAGLFSDGQPIDYQKVKDNKTAHMEIGSRKVEELLKNERFNYLKDKVKELYKLRTRFYESRS